MDRIWTLPNWTWLHLIVQYESRARLLFYLGLRMHVSYCTVLLYVPGSTVPDSNLLLGFVAFQQPPRLQALHDGIEALDDPHQIMFVIDIIRHSDCSFRLPP
jgi:hypothetical protein